MILRQRLASGLAAIGIAAALTTSPARAQDAPSPAQATGRALFNEGVALFTKGDYEAACPKFEASLKAYPGLGTRGKLAECYEKIGRVASAWQVYREVAQLATRSGDPTREQIANERAKALEPKLSYVTVAVSPANDLPGLVVKRNGREVERSKLGGAEPVDSGNIAFEVTAPGRKPFTGQMTVMQGQSARFEVPALYPDAPASAAAPPPPPPVEQPLLVQHDSPRWQKPVGIVLIGAGVVGVGVGGILGLSAKSKYDGAFDGGGCDSGTKTCDTTGQRTVDDAKSTATLSTILFAAGGVLVVAGVVVFLTAPSVKPRALQITPMTTAGGGGLMVGGAL